MIDTVTLYRASDRAVADRFSSFSPDIEVAEAYLDNPGLGGPTVFSYDVVVQPERVLRLHDESRAVAKLDDAVQWSATDDERLEDRFARVYEALEQTRGLAERLSEDYDWITYDDDFPNWENPAPETWVKLSAGKLVGQTMYCKNQDEYKKLKRRLMR